MTQNCITFKIFKIMMTKSNKKSSVVISWTINVTKTDTEGKKSESHMDGNVSMEMKDYREFIRETVSSAIKGVADGIDKNDDEE